MGYPKCFDSKEEFETWVSGCEDDESELPSPRFSFCDYCYPMHQLNMIIENRCENPDYDTESNLQDQDMQGRLL